MILLGIAGGGTGVAEGVAAVAGGAAGVAGGVAAVAGGAAGVAGVAGGAVGVAGGAAGGVAGTGDAEGNTGVAGGVAAGGHFRSEGADDLRCMVGASPVCGLGSGLGTGDRCFGGGAGGCSRAGAGVLSVDLLCCSNILLRAATLPVTSTG